MFPSVGAECRPSPPLRGAIVAPNRSNVCGMVAGDEGSGSAGAQPALEEGRGSHAESDGLPPESSGARAGVEPLRLQAELLARREEVEELRASVQVAEQQLARAQADLEAERERHAAYAARFKHGLATIQGSAEEALAASDREREELLRECERLRTEGSATRAELEQAQLMAEVAHAEADRAQVAAEGARAETQLLLERLERIRDALDDEA